MFWSDCTMVVAEAMRTTQKFPDGKKNKQKTLLQFRFLSAVQLKQYMHTVQSQACCFKVKLLKIDRKWITECVNRMWTRLSIFPFLFFPHFRFRSVLFFVFFSWNSVLVFYTYSKTIRHFTFLNIKTWLVLINSLGLLWTLNHNKNLREQQMQAA